jgi:glycerol-3-phosphate dehydrogenase
LALTVEDVLARRLRLLFLDARAAMEVAPMVADIMEKELGLSFIPMDFNAVAEGYLP